jgi:hypothetical protein
MDVVVVNAIAECERSTMDWCYDVLRDVLYLKVWILQSKKWPDPLSF